MERRCLFRVTLPLPRGVGSRQFRFSGEKSLPFIPSAGRRIHLGGREVYFDIKSAEYDMQSGVFLVDGNAQGPAETMQKLADGLRQLGWQEEEVKQDSSGDFMQFV